MLHQGLNLDGQQSPSLNPLISVNAFKENTPIKTKIYQAQLVFYANQFIRPRIQFLFEDKVLRQVSLMNEYTPLTSIGCTTSCFKPATFFTS